MIVEPDFLDHWKTRTLVALLGDDELAPLYIIRIWAHCQNRRQSRFETFPTAALKGVCRFNGDAELLERSLFDSGFIARGEDGSLSVVGWDEHNSTLVANWVNGKRGGRPRNTQNTHEKKPIDNPNANWVNPMETQTQIGVTEKRREEKIGEEKHTADADCVRLSKRQPKAYSESFEQWYAIYPRKVSKEDAAAAFGRALTKIVQRRGMTNEEALDWLCGVTSVFSKSTAGNSGTFTPHPASWLNQGRYDDDQAEWARNRDTPTKPQESIYKPITPRRAQ
jgi:hypothetical protein